MLRELIDAALLEDFLFGAARMGGLRWGAYDMSGGLIVSTAGGSSLPRQTAELPESVEPPTGFHSFVNGLRQERVAFPTVHGARLAMAPVATGEQIVGFIAIGGLDPDFERELNAALAEPAPDTSDPTDGGIATIPRRRALDVLAESDAIVLLRWSARLLSEWCREAINAEQLALVGDIGEIMAGERKLQSVLDRIVAETARVMQCRYCALRLYNADTDELSVAAVHNLGNYVVNDIRLRRDNPLDDEALRGRTVYIEDALTDPRVRHQDITRMLGIVSGLITGLMYQGKPVGTLRIYTDHHHRFHASERHLLRAVAAQAAIAIVNARLVEERLHTADTKRQLEIAGELQSRLVHTPPNLANVDAAVVFEPSWMVSGDFCDFFPLRDGRQVAVIADVVGHGVPAALLMTYVRGALRAIGQTCSDLGELMNRINIQVHKETQSHEFLTMGAVALDPRGRRMGYCSAGHEPPLILRGNEIIALEEGGTVIGISPSERFRESSFDLKSNDFLLLYTDGAVEAMNFDGRQFSRERLNASLAQQSNLPPALALRGILWDIRRFVGLAEQSDDITMVGMRVR